MRRRAESVQLMMCRVILHDATAVAAAAILDSQGLFTWNRFFEIAHFILKTACVCCVQQFV